MTQQFYFQVFTQEKRKHVYKKICTRMFIAASFIVTQTAQVSINWRMNKQWYTFTMEHYSVFKSNKLLIHAARWMNLRNITPNLRNIIPSERSLTQKSTQYMTLLTWSSRTNKTNLCWKKIRIVVACGGPGWDWLGRGTRELSGVM